MKKALIILAAIEGFEKIKLDKDYDYIVCADAGYLYARQLGLKVSRVIGDFDTAPAPADDDVEILPIIKDFTDSEAAVHHVFEKGYMDITVLGGLGGRFDHTMGNIGILSRYTKLGAHIRILDGVNRVTMLEPGSYIFRKDGYKYLGVISYSPYSSGLTLEGFKYPLENTVLGNDTTLGVSNEILEDEGVITFSEGQLLIIQSS